MRVCVEGARARAFQEQRIDLSSVEQRTKGQCLKAKGIFFHAGANPEAENVMQAGNEKETLKKKNKTKHWSVKNP